jgi:hypothetical protein
LDVIGARLRFQVLPSKRRIMYQKRSSRTSIT